MPRPSPIVSVVIPCRNCAAFLPQTLRSVLAQSRPPDEVIVVDDGSDDGSGRIASEFGSPVRVVAQPHLGVSAARNAGIRQAQGDVVALLDADDLWDREKLARQLAYLDAHPDAGAVVTSVGWFTGSPGSPLPYLQVTDQLLRQSTPADFLIHCWINQSAVAIRRAVALDTPYPEGIGDSEDMIQATELRLRTTIGAIPEMLTFYRHHPGQASRRSDHGAMSLEVRVRWAERHQMTLGAGSTAAAVLPILEHRLRDITPHYWRRDIGSFRKERAVVSRLWPASEPKPKELTRVLLPGALLRLRDWFLG